MIIQQQRYVVYAREGDSTRGRRSKVLESNVNFIQDDSIVFVPKLGNRYHLGF